MARRYRRAPCRTGGVCCLARQAAGGNPGLGNWRSAASDCRSRSRRTERHRAAARLWPRLSLPLMATRQWLRPLHSRLTRQSTRDITPTTRWVTPPRPPSDRNGGRFEIGMGGRLQIGIPGRLRRNPHLDGLVNASSAWDSFPMRSLSEPQFWFVVAGIALTPMLIFGIADGIGWFLHRALGQRPEIASQSEGEQARDEPEPEAPPR
jgi:hypothetical protein